MENSICFVVFIFESFPNYCLFFRKSSLLFFNVSDLSVVDKNSIQVVTERHRRVEGGADGVLRALVDGQGLETVRVDPGPDPQVLVFNKFLLDPT